MSIRGVYVRGGEVTEVEIESMKPERELQVFTFPKKQPKAHKRIEGLSMGNAALLGITSGLTTGALLGAFFMSDWWPFKLMVIVTAVLDAIMLIENMTKEVK